MEGRAGGGIIRSGNVEGGAPRTEIRTEIRTGRAQGHAHEGDSIRIFAATITSFFRIAVSTQSDHNDHNHKSKP